MSISVMPQQKREERRAKREERNRKEVRKKEKMRKGYRGSVLNASRVTDWMSLSPCSENISLHDKLSL